MKRKLEYRFQTRTCAPRVCIAALLLLLLLVLAETQFSSGKRKCRGIDTLTELTKTLDTLYTEGVDEEAEQSKVVDPGSRRFSLPGSGFLGK